MNFVDVIKLVYVTYYFSDIIGKIYKRLDEERSVQKRDLLRRALVHTTFMLGMTPIYMIVLQTKMETTWLGFPTGDFVYMSPPIVPLSWVLMSTIYHYWLGHHNLIYENRWLNFGNWFWLFVVRGF